MRQYKIDGIDSMKEFFRDIIVELNVTLMPDDDFNDYVKYGTDEPCFSKNGADYLNQIMTDCFQYCEDNELDIYEIAEKYKLKSIKKEGCYLKVLVLSNYLKYYNLG